MKQDGNKLASQCCSRSGNLVSKKLKLFLCSERNSLSGKGDKWEFIGITL